MAQHGKSSASVHLPLDHLGLVVDSLGAPVVVRAFQPARAAQKGCCKPDTFLYRRCHAREEKRRYRRVARTIYHKGLDRIYRIQKNRQQAAGFPITRTEGGLDLEFRIDVSPCDIQDRQQTRDTEHVFVERVFKVVRTNAEDGEAQRLQRMGISARAG